MQEHGQVPACQTDLAVARCDGCADTGCGCQYRCPLGPTEVVLKQGREGLVLLNTVEGDLSAQFLGDIQCGWRLGKSAVLVVCVVDTVVAEVVQDVVGVGCSGVLCESDTAGHVASEPDLVIEHSACGDYVQGDLHWVSRGCP